MSNLQIQATTNYGQFKTLKGNRPVNPTHVRKLAASIQKRNLMPYLPIVVNKDMYVIDGQHRIEAAKKIQEEVYYITIPSTGMEEIRLLNANSKPWGPKEYAESYAMEGNQDYITLLSLVNEYSIPLTCTAEVLSGHKITSGGKHDSIRSGKFKVKNLKNATSFLKKFSEIVPFAEGRPTKNRDFMKALQDFYDRGADHEHFLQQLQKGQKRISKQPDYLRWLLAMSDVYNSYMPQKKRINVLPASVS